MEKPAVQWVEISAEEAGQRIDNFLQRLLKGVPRSRIYRLLRRGEVRVNRARARPDYRIRSGDQVRIPPVRRSAAASADSGAAGAAERLRDAILYEDERLLVLNKPAGMAVHGGSGLSFGVIEALRVMRPDAPYLELVHRLDRDTSGCLLIAKRRSELRTLHALLRAGQVQKRYLLLVQGDWRPERFEVTVALRKNLLRGGERMVEVDAEGKQALTRFHVLARYPGASLLEAEPRTGRTHQIRVHAAHRGHPLAGDAKYGDAVFNRKMRALGLKRLFLHAHFIAFADAARGRAIEISAPLAQDLRNVIQQLESRPDTGQSSQLPT
ncbi:MAG: 23S rRNA pseudouridine(955/2504/2580) synthase RluC [Gammaproteobacteria bacterium]|jgi:23S rRNA pseudouridine955/2504/2580 synthase